MTCGGQWGWGEMLVWYVHRGNHSLLDIYLILQVDGFAMLDVFVETVHAAGVHRERQLFIDRHSEYPNAGHRQHQQDE